MRVDSETLQAFYASALGVVVQRQALRRLAAAWPDAAGCDVLGVGFAAPFLERYRASARRVIAAAPAQHGAQRWPRDGKAALVLTEEARLPLMDAVFDRVLIAHALEEAANPRAFLREIWRVMAPEGRLIVIAANRSGLWARADQTPFGHGRPFSRAQLADLLDDAMFLRVASARALYAPPWSWAPLLKSADVIERVGETLLPAFGGLILMEATKRLAAEPPRAPSRAPLRSAQPIPAAKTDLPARVR